MAMVKHPRYRPVLDRMFEEFSKAIGKRIYSVSASVLLSGPQMGIFFHVDPAETMLWHVRGTKTLYVYPATDEGLPERALEAILLKENLSDAPYRPEMEAVVTPVRLEAGESVAWPLHGPHRVLNGPDLNVSVSCEYSTLHSLLTNGVFYANGRLRRATGLQAALAHHAAGARAGLLGRGQGAARAGAAQAQRRGGPSAPVRRRPVGARLHPLARGLRP